MECNLSKSLSLKILLVVSIVGLGFVFAARAYTNLTVNTQSTNFSSISWTNASGTNTTSTNIYVTNLTAAHATMTHLMLPLGGMIVGPIDGAFSIGESNRRAGFIYGQIIDGDEMNVGALNISSVVYPSGTTGSQQPDTQGFRVNFAAGAASLVVTSTVAFSNSFPVCTVNTNDATMTNVVVVPSDGYVTLYAKPAAPTGETKVGCVLFY